MARRTTYIQNSMARARRNGQLLWSDKMEFFQVITACGCNFYLFHVMAAFFYFFHVSPPFWFIPCDGRHFDLFHVMAALLIYSMWWPLFWIWFTKSWLLLCLLDWLVTNQNVRQTKLIKVNNFKLYIVCIVHYLNCEYYCTRTHWKIQTLKSPA